MPGYHYKRKGLAYGGNTAIGGHHAGAVAGEGTGAQGPAGGQSSQGNYGGGTSSNGESDSGGGLQSLSDIVGLYSKYSPTALACLLYTSPSPRDRTRSRMPSSA